MKIKLSLFGTVLLAMAILMIIDGCEQKMEPLNATPPIAEKAPHETEKHGITWVDDYFWLRERDNPDVIAYLEAENAYTDTIMKHTEKLQEKIFEEIKGRIKETDLTVPYRKDDYYYYNRTEEGKEYRIYCRKKGSLEAEEEIVLDVNKEAEGKEFMRLGVYKPSPDHKLLAYAVDTMGNERYILRVKNLETGEIYDDVLENISTSVQWANDNKTLFYFTRDDAWRTHKFYRHTLGAKQTDDPLLYHEKDDAFWMGIGKTRDEKFLLLGIASQTSSEYCYLPTDNPEGEFKIIHPRQEKLEYDVSHHGDYFYILCNDDAKNFKLMKAPETDPSMKNWTEVIPHRKEIKLDAVDMFRDHMVVYERKDGLKQIHVYHFESGEDYYIDFPEPVYVTYQSNNVEFNTKVVRFTYESMVTPEIVYDFNMDTREREKKKQQEVLGGYNADDYQSERIIATAEDGTRVPISMVYRKGMQRDGSNPLLLSGYGAYGISSEPYFSRYRLSLLDRGFIYAKAHVRGGGEMGRYWYEDGRLLNKKNTFTDFIACAEHLIAEGYTVEEKLSITGGSAGGLLIGAVVNMRPELFKAAIAGVPFVDIINTMLDETIPLTVIEYTEWGNPNEKDYFDYMMSYSPYDNVTAQDYPNMLIEAGLNDPRVQYWEPAKWTAKLRTLKTDNNRLILKTNMGAGHGGKSGRYQQIWEAALEYAFLIDVLGVEY